MSFSDVINLIEYVRGRNDANKLSTVQRDIGYARTPDDIETIRSQLPEYQINNPNIADKANTDLDQWLTRYTNTNKLVAEQANEKVAQDAFTNTANLFGKWRKENPYEGQSQFFDQYASAVEGPPAIDPRALMLDQYKKGFDLLAGGMSEGEDRAIKARERVEENRNGTQFNTDIAEINNQSTLWPYKTFSDLETDVYDSAARARIKPEEARQYLDSQRQLWDKRTYLEPYTIKQGESTERGYREKNPFGYTGKTLGSVSSNAANDAAARANATKAAKEKTTPDYRTATFPDGEIKQYNINNPNELAIAEALRLDNKAIITKSDTPDSTTTTVVDKEGNETKINKKIKRPIKGGKYTLPNTPQVREARKQGYSDKEIFDFLNKGN